jgi:carbon starvation protein
MPGNIAASFLVVCAWGSLIYSGNISSIWPMFGVANQLLAAVAFGVGTMFIVKSGKLRYAWVTFIPMVFMFITTFTASWELAVMFRGKAVYAASKTEAFTLRIDSLLVFLMAALAIIVLTDTLYKLYLHLSVKLEVIKEEID